MAEAGPHQGDDRWEEAFDAFDVISEAEITSSEGWEPESAS